MTREEKVQALFQDENAVKEVFVEDADQTLANLAARGIEMSKEELGDLVSGFLEGAGIHESELSEDALEDVAGGFSLTDINKSLKKVGDAFKLGRQDKKNKTANGIKFVESAKTIEGKGWRGIGYTLGYFLP